MTIANSGNVGIGTIAPTQKLEVNGTVKASSFQGDGAGLVNVPGAAPWQVQSGGSVTAAPNMGYVAQGPNWLTVLLPASPAVGTMVNILGAGSGGWRVNANAGQTSSLLGGGTGGGGSGAGSWVPRESSRNWTAVASSSDGAKLVASCTTGLYTSTDSGVTWTPHETTRNWAAVASASDGTKLVAGSLNEYGGYVDGYLHTSTSSGASWTRRTQTGDWLQIASSSDGTRLVAIDRKPDFSHQLFVSADSGVNWTVSVAWPSAPMFTSVASAADGITMMAAKRAESGRAAAIRCRHGRLMLAAGRSPRTPSSRGLARTRSRPRGTAICTSTRPLGKTRTRTGSSNRSPSTRACRRPRPS
jgi:hypothetical protein